MAKGFMRWSCLASREKYEVLKKGIVESFSQQKEFGFIIQDNGIKLPFHSISIQMDGYKVLNVGDRVGFEVEETTFGIEARKVTKL